MKAYPYLLYLLLLCPVLGQAQPETECNPLAASDIASGEASVYFGSVSNALSATRKANFTVGQPATGQAYLGTGLLSGGFWGRLLAPPIGPVVRASQGDFPDRIEIRWTMDPFSPKASGGFILRRDGSTIANLNRSSTSFIDFNVQAGEFYTYEVIGINAFGQGFPGSNVGFVNPNGVVTGKVETASQNPVKEVVVTLTPTAGYALSFDGQDDFLCMSYQDALPDTAFTATAWVKVGGAEERTGIIDLGSDLNKNWWLHAVNTPEGKGLIAGVGDGAPHEVVYLFEDAPSGWHHVAFTYASGLGMLYVDGKFAGLLQAPMLTEPARFRLGAFREEGGFFAGRLDDVRIYDRMLTQRELLLFKGITASSLADGLVAYWKFDEGTGAKIFDITANDFDTELDGPAFDTDSAPVLNGGVTDEAGLYYIEGVNYSQAQSFQAKPSKKFYDSYALEFNPAFDSEARLPAFGLPDSVFTITLTAKPFSQQLRQTLLAHESYELEWYVEAGNYWLTTGGSPVNLGPVDTGYQVLSLLIDRVGQTVSSYINSNQVGGSQPLQLSQDYSGGHWYIGSRPDGQHTLLGLVDEWAVFDTLLPVADLQLHAAPMGGIDPGDTRLANYFGFDEGSGAEVRDAGELMTGFGQLKGIVFTPDAYRQRARPHLFSPASRIVNLNTSNTAIGEINFRDNSTVPVAGVIRYLNTDCAAPNTEIYVNGAPRIPPVKTNEEGRFIAEFEPGATVRLQPVREGQAFLPAVFETFNLQSPVAGVLFQNQTKRTVVGRVAGGLCGATIIPETGSVKVKARTLNGCYEKEITISPGNTAGTFVFDDLPPDSIEIAVSHHDIPEIKSYLQSQIGGVTLDMRFTERDTVDFVYRSSPELEFSELPQNSIGDNMLSMTQPSQLNIKVFEPYLRGETCYLDTAELVITNEIADLTEDIDTLMTAGVLIHTFKAGAPNIIESEGFRKKIEVKARRDSSSNYVAKSVEAVVLGRRPRETQFATTSPGIPMLILHDPPGDGSYAFVEEGETTCSALTFSGSIGGDASVEAVVSLGADLSVDVGIGAGISLDVDNTLDIGATFEMSYNNFTSKTAELCMTTTKTISTSDEDLVVGSNMGGDVIMGAALNLLYGITDELNYIEADSAYDLSQGIYVFPEGFATTFLYTERQIRDIVIPGLQTIGDMASVDRWNSILNTNETIRNVAAFKENISFAAGTVFEETYTSEEATSATLGGGVTTRFAISGAVGAAVAGIGGEVSTELGVTLSGGSEITDTEQSTRTVGYVLTDDDVFDNFTVDIREDKVFKVPVFDLKAGTTSCPNEPTSSFLDAQQQYSEHREEVGLSADRLAATNVNAEDAAVFTLSLENTAPSGDIGFYILALVPESNPDGAALSVNGDALLGDGQMYQIPANGTQTVTLTIERGPEAYTYENLRIALYSECEFERAVGLGIPRAGVDPRFYKELELDVYFLEPCSEVSIGSPMQNWLITPEDTNRLLITLNGYDKSDADLQLIRLQYRPTMGDGSWINIAEVPKDSLGALFEVVEWDLSPLNDGPYEIRAVTQCSGTSLPPGFSKVIKGRKETQPPQLFGTPKPADGILNLGDEISVMFTKRVNCNQIIQAAGIGSNIQNNNLGLYDTSTGELVDAVISCSEDEIVIVPNVANPFIENKTLRVRAEGIEDLFGNAMQTPIVWEFFVNRSALYWSEARISEVVTEGNTLVIEREIKNQSGLVQSFELQNIPSWAQVSPMMGSILPGGTETVTFTVRDDLIAGAYSGLLQMVTAEGSEPLTMDLRVVCPPPAWSVNPMAFSSSMNLTLALSIEGEPSSDRLDKVAAFVGGELRGTADVEFVPQLNTHLVFLTVYSNQPTGEEVTFKVWDAEECILYNSTQESFPFTAGGFVGNPTSPQALNTNVRQLKRIPLYPGWNWISYNVEVDNPAIGQVLSSVSRPEGATIKGQSAFALYFEAGNAWAGTLTALSHTQSYQYKSTFIDSLWVEGRPVDTDSTVLSLQPGWNWISYLPQQGLPVDTALASLSPSNGDVVKGQGTFAQYVAGVGWVGNLNFMSPTKGYQIRLQNGGALAYPQSLSGAGEEELRVPYRLAERLPSAYWEVDAYDYELNMNLVAIVQGEDGEVLLQEGDEVGAFVGEQLRGAGPAIYIEALGAHLVFLTVFANEEGEPLSFRYYDSAVGEERLLSEELTFISNTVLGEVESPVLLSLLPPSSSNGYRSKGLSFRAYPNPAQDVASMEYHAPRAGESLVCLYDLLGREVGRLEGTAQPGLNVLEWHVHHLPDGLYLAVLRTGGQQAVQKIEIRK